jgi:hypothetical protein
MNRRYEIFTTSSGPSTGKALLNQTIFRPSQTGETVPLSKMVAAGSLDQKAAQLEESQAAGHH